MIQVVWEQHKCPPEVTRHLAFVGGLNPFGQPRFRLVWGMSRLALIGGMWTDTDNSGNMIREVSQMRLEPKYFPYNRWYLEQWMGPETYPHPVIWEETMFESELGPFPYRGEYEMAWKMEDKRGQFIPFETVASIAAEIVRMILAGKDKSKAENNLAIKRTLEKKDKDWDTHADAVLDDTNVFEGKPHIYVPQGICRPSLNLPGVRA